MNGWEGFRISMKLKHLKAKIKGWAGQHMAAPSRVSKSSIKQETGELVVRCFWKIGI